MQAAFLHSLAACNPDSDRVVIVPDGDVLVSGAGGFVMDVVAANRVIAEFKDRGNQIPIDFEHASVFKAAQGEAAPAIGWINKLEYEPGVGLIGKVEWSDAAKQHIQRRSYKYLSPVLLFNSGTRDLVSVTSVALTNQPRIKNMRELLAASMAANLGGHPMTTVRLIASLANGESVPTFSLNERQKCIAETMREFKKEYQSHPMLRDIRMRTYVNSGLEHEGFDRLTCAERDAVPDVSDSQRSRVTMSFTSQMEKRR